jgi:hypothetical protein
MEEFARKVDMMTNKLKANAPAVALQQRSGDRVTKYDKLTTNQLHQQTLNARDAFFKMCAGAETYAADVLLPLCEQIIKRYKLPGIAAKHRPNSQPTVEAYFRSITLNYSTVRSWIHRKKLRTEMFDSTECKQGGDEKLFHLTEREARLLGSASAGHDLVKAIKQGGNVDEAIQEFEEHTPSPQQIDEYIEHPVKVAAATEVEKLAIRICKLIDRNDGSQGHKILALARQLLVMAAPISAQLHRNKKRGGKPDATKKMPPRREVTMVSPHQPTSGVERSA